MSDVASGTARNLREEMKVMEATYEALFSEMYVESDLGNTEPVTLLAKAIEIARSAPRAAAISAAGATYFALGVKIDQPLTIKDPWKKPLFSAFAKAIKFKDYSQLVDVFEIAITQKVFEDRAAAIASVPFFHANLERMMTHSMTLQEFKASAIVAAWSAKLTVEEIVKDIASMRR